MRTIQQATANLEASIPVIATRYTQGVQGADWAGPASSDAAEQRWGAGVQRAITNKSRQTAIRGVGNQVWQQAALGKGAQNIGEGIRRSLGKYTANFGKILAAVQPVVAALPPKTTDTMANINNRLVPVVKAMQQAAGRG